MAVLSVHNVALRGISACVPSLREDNMDLPLIPQNQRDTFVKTTGIRYRRIAGQGTTAADLCRISTERLLRELGWQASDIELLIFVTQTPDYVIPNSASIIQQQLGLPKTCLAMDINLGCSGYVYGLSVIGSLLQNMPGKRGLLLVGDCSSAIVSARDKATYPLFSDAGSATAIEYKEGEIWHFNLQTDGAGYEDIMVKGGGMRHPFGPDSLREHEYAAGEVRSDLQMKLDGVNIFNFALREVAPNIETLLRASQTDQASIDFFVLHQANKLILECVRKKLKEDSSRFPYSLHDFGNTSSASIPVTIVAQLQEALRAQDRRLLLCGFGVGLSWGSAIVPAHSLQIIDLIEI